MQAIGIIILLGILILLFVGIARLGKSQSPYNGRSRSVQDDWNTSHGAYNRYAAREKLDRIAGEQRARSHRH